MDLELVATFDPGAVLDRIADATGRLLADAEALDDGDMREASLLAWLMGRSTGEDLVTDDGRPLPELPALY